MILVDVKKQSSKLTSQQERINISFFSLFTLVLANLFIL